MSHDWQATKLLELLANEEGDFMAERVRDGDHYYYRVTGWKELLGSGGVHDVDESYGDGCVEQLQQQGYINLTPRASDSTTYHIQITPEGLDHM